MGVCGMPYQFEQPAPDMNYTITPVDPSSNKFDNNDMMTNSQPRSDGSGPSWAMLAQEEEAWTEAMEVIEMTKDDHDSNGAAKTNATKVSSIEYHLTHSPNPKYLAPDMCGYPIVHLLTVAQDSTGIDVIMNTGSHAHRVSSLLSGQAHWSTIWIIRR